MPMDINEEQMGLAQGMNIRMGKDMATEGWKSGPESVIVNDQEMDLVFLFQKEVRNCENMLQDRLVADEEGIQKDGDINGDRKHMDQTLNGLEFWTSRGEKFDFDFLIDYGDGNGAVRNEEIHMAGNSIGEG